MPTSGRLREVRVSRTVVLPLRTSPGLTGCCHFSVSTPGEPKELEIEQKSIAEHAHEFGADLPTGRGQAADISRHRRIDMERPRVELPREGNHFGFGDGARGKRKNIAGGEIFEETLGHPWQR